MHLSNIIIFDLRQRDGGHVVTGIVRTELSTLWSCNLDPHFVVSTRYIYVYGLYIVDEYSNVLANPQLRSDFLLDRMSRAI